MNILILITIVAIVLILVIAKYSITKTKKDLTETFKSISYDVIQQNNKAFMDLASASFEKYHSGFKVDLENKQKELKTILNPVKESLDKMDLYTKEVEKQRTGAYSSLNKQLESLIASEQSLRKETHNLVSALRSPNIRGSWGQIHLRRVVELAGLLNNCDFYEQKSNEVDNKTYRPDLIVRLPGERQIIIDAKTPIEAFLQAQDENETFREEKLKLHAVHLKKHIKDLSTKEYFTKFKMSLDYVILFLPAESFLSVAIKFDPTLLEVAAEKNIIIATPTTLIAILKTIAYSWKQDNLSKDALKIANVGAELYERLFKMNSHFMKIGKNLSSSVDAYNQAIASLNSRVMVSARKLKDMGLSYKSNDLTEISKTCSVRSLEDA